MLSSLVASGSRRLLRSGVLCRFRTFSAAVSADKTAPARPHLARAAIPANDTVRLANSLTSLLQSFKSTIQTSGCVFTTDIDKAIQTLQVNPEVRVNSTQALELLRCCGFLMTNEKNTVRTQMALQLWKQLEDRKVDMDASHYNALIRTHIDNGHKFNPTEFLAWMEEKGVEPNRVTYQHIVAKFCQDGNMQEASMILDHMTKNGMPFNEYVFHSLITGYCLSKDFPAAKGIFDMMKESALSIGSEACLAYLVGMVRAGETWENVEKEMNELTDKLEVRLDDRDLLQLIVEMISAGKKEDARQVISRLPKKQGFFNELRNFIPQMIFAGDVDIAFDLYMDSMTHFRGMNENDTNKPNAKYNGVFFLRALIRADANPEECLKVVKSFMDNGINVDSPTMLLVTCAKGENIEYGNKMYKLFEEAFGKNFQNQAIVDEYTRNTMSQLHTAQEVSQFMNNMELLCLRTRPSSLSDNVLGRFYIANNNNMMQTVRSLGSSSMPFSLIFNSGVRYLLNQESDNTFVEAESMLCTVNTPLKPVIWNASLARSYLATGNLKALTTHFVTVLRNARKDAERGEDHERFLYKTLQHIHSMSHRYYPEEPSDLVLEKVLLEMKQLGIGLPSIAAKELTQVVKEEKVKSLITELEDMHKSGSLDEERLENLFVKKAASVKMAYAKERKGFIPIGRDGFVKNEDLPSDIKELEKLLGLLEKRGKFNGWVCNRLFSAYIEAGEWQKCLTLMENAVKNAKFEPMFPHIETIVTHLIKEGKLEESKSLINTLTDANLKFFGSTANKICMALLAKGEEEGHKECLQFVNGLKSECLISHYWAKFLLEYKDAQRLEEMIQTLKEKGLINGNASNLSSLVTIHLNNDDLETAVQTFERFAKDEKRLPGKHKLMEVLIQKEDMERMQRVLDASIEVIGEEKSLYDLAHNFLDMKKYTQSRKLLETPGMRYNSDRCLYIGQQLTRNGNLEALEELVKQSKSLFACDRDAMFNLLLNAHLQSQNVDLDKVSDVMMMMQEENFPPSNQMKIKIANALKKGGREVPFKVPERRSRAKKQEEVEVEVEENTVEKNLS